MIRTLVGSAIIVSGLLIGGCSSDNDDDTSSNTPGEETTADANPVVTPGVGNSVYDNIVNNSDLTTLRSAIDAANLAGMLDNEESAFTVFAPNNAAFVSFAQSMPDLNLLNGLLTDPASLVDTLTPILTFHVVPGLLVATDFDFIDELDTVVGIDPATGLPVLESVTPAPLPTVNGTPLPLAPSTTSPSGIAVGGVDVIITDSNFDPDKSVGNVHIVDSVLIPTQ